MIFRKVLGPVAFFVMTCVLSWSNAAEFSRVAYDDAGVAEKQPHLISGSIWRFENPGNADEKARTAAFGDQVEFRYQGLNPKAEYKLRLRFYSDADREESVLAGDTVLLPSVKLENGKVAAQEVVLPPKTYANGKLFLVLKKISGPNVVVSEVEVISNDPALLSAVPLPEAPMPILTPRPIAAPQELGGTWKFHAEPSKDFEKAASHDDWSNIEVPGEWVMQGFKVKTDTPAAYFRTFELSEKPQGQRFKLRFSAVYSLCRVWVNGIEVGGHEGGFVPFEFDVTDALKVGKNTLALSVQSESLLDKLSCATQYASHPLGGITRKVQLFSVPDVHVSDLKIETVFEKDFRNATLIARMVVRNQSSKTASGSVQVSIAPLGKSAKVGLGPLVVDYPPIPSGETRLVKAQLAVPSPSKWDSEHPNLYELTLETKTGAGKGETVKEVFGFRQVEVRGKQVFVNGSPLKIHGACRHEVHPLLGRSLTPDLWKKDAEIFRDGNCNFIRTSHYPPAEEFLQACDRVGIFVELEAPLCWVGHSASYHFQKTPNDEEVFQLLAQANLETVQGYPNHPSVIMRSMANESGWSSLFARVNQAVKKADPTRPVTFHDQSWGDAKGGSAVLPMANHHYPGLGGPDHCDRGTRPVHFGEYSHLESYNRRELATDPGLRDLWGQGLNLMWGKMRAAPGCFGGSIWAAIDDTFFLPSGETVGYGTWGPIDGWRRPKPEYWHMKKAYSPVWLPAHQVAVPAEGKPIQLEVENRHFFTNLNEVRFEWKLGEKSGTVSTSAAPGEKATLEIPVSQVRDGQLLELRAISPRGFMEDEWQIAIGTDPRIAPPVPSQSKGKVQLKKTESGWEISSGTIVFDANSKTGTIKATGKKGTPLLLSGPELLLLPENGDQCGGTQMSGMEKDVALFSDTCRDWKVSSVTANTTASGIEVQVEGEYREAKGKYTWKFGNDGSITIAYDFTVSENGKCNPRQIGVVFTLPRDCDTISWRRKGFWSSYPAYHIGRTEGSATAFVKNVPLSGLAGPRVEPTWTWGEDGNRYGSNDFRSTKMNILEGMLRTQDGNGLRILSDGSQHLRAWIEGEQVRLLVADYANEGTPPFFSEHVVPHHPLKPGQKVEGKVQIELQ